MRFGVPNAEGVVPISTRWSSSATPSRWGAVPVATALVATGRWCIIAAVAAAMIVPGIAAGGLHFGLSDVLGTLGVLCWFIQWSLARSQRAVVLGALWPALVGVAGLLSMISSADVLASTRGIVELLGLWILPAIAIPNLFESSVTINRVLLSASVGSVIAAAANLWTAAHVGMADGIPAVLGPVGGFQGYFQVIGLAVATPQLVMAISGRRVSTALLWAAAACLNSAALVLTQTRGAWLAAVIAFVALGISWRRSVLVACVVVLLAVVANVLGSDSTAIVSERVQSVFSLEANLSGFESSVVRMGLALTAWKMFVAHPLLGVGLKNFPTMLPFYAPPGMPFELPVGAAQVLTPIEGPHSTYLSLLAEVGIVGAIAFVAWIVAATWRHYRATRTSASPAEQAQAATLLAGGLIVAVFNTFAEMHATGAQPLIFILALAYAQGRVAHRPPVTSTS